MYCSPNNEIVRNEDTLTAGTLTAARGCGQGRSCGQKVGSTNGTFTCFDMESLVAIAKAFNKWSRQICNGIKCIDKKNLEKIDIDNVDKTELYKQIYKRLFKLCSDDYCWADLDFINSIKDAKVKNKIKFFTFKPKGTLTVDMWLNTDDINEVIQQYQELINNRYGKNYFKYLGAHPSDYYKLYNINYPRLQKNYKTLGIVFNTDTHDKSGSHWVCCFIDNKNKKIEYFDSLGKRPNKYMQKFLDHFKSYSFVYNKIEHQKGGSNCGVYCCYFIIQKLKGKTFDEINSRILTDNLMSKYRNEIFRPRIF